MRASSKEIKQDIAFCKQLMDRLLLQTEKMSGDVTPWDRHTVVQQDIIRLRRELNEVRKKLNWDYKER